MMLYQTIHTDQAPAAIGPYAQAVQAGPWVFVSGQIGLDPQTGKLNNSDFSSEVQQALANMRQILKKSGLDIRNIVAVDVFLKDITTFSEFNELYASFMNGLTPARAVVEVSALPKGASVEIKCIALKDDGN